MKVNGVGPSWDALLVEIQWGKNWSGKNLDVEQARGNPKKQ